MQKKVIVAAVAVSLALSSCSLFSKNEPETPRPNFPPMVDPLEPSPLPDPASPDPVSPAPIPPTLSASGANEPNGTSGSWTPGPEAAATGTVDASEVDAAIREIDSLFEGISGK